MMDATLEDSIRWCSTDISALEAVYTELRRDVFALAYSLLRDFAMAEDAMQETFARLPRAARKFHSATGGKAFVLAIARHVSFEYCRSRAKAYPSSFLKANSAETDMAEETYLGQLLGACTREQAEVISLHVFSGMTFEEISRLTHTPASTLKSRFAQAKAVLRPLLEKEAQT